MLQNCINFEIKLDAEISILMQSGLDGLQSVGSVIYYHIKVNMDADIHSVLMIADQNSSIGSSNNFCFLSVSSSCNYCHKAKLYEGKCADNMNDSIGCR